MQHDAYKVQRMHIAMDITKAPGAVSSGTEHQFVRWLFHGTGQEKIEHIVNSQATGYLPGYWVLAHAYLPMRDWLLAHACRLCSGRNMG